MHQTIIILDFGSQVTQLIARRIRELNVYCEVYPWNHPPLPSELVKGLILSGSPHSVHEDQAPMPDLSAWNEIPMLGICYGAQLLAHQNGGKVLLSTHREYVRANLVTLDRSHILLKEFP